MIDESVEYTLEYKRSEMLPGESISSTTSNKLLPEALQTCNTVVLSLYWKPIGDSLLFLSIVTGIYDYLKLIHRENDVRWVIDSKFNSILKYIQLLNNATLVDDPTNYFLNIRNSTNDAVLITDDDPFETNEKGCIFNSETFKFPKYIEKRENFLKEYTSRPARYYLTLEKEIGVILGSDPNNSLPNFVLESNETLRQEIFSTFHIDPDNSTTKFIAIISQASIPQKKFGCVRFLKLAKKFIDKGYFVLFLANSKEESPREWYQVLRMLENNPNIILITAQNFIMLAYLFARCKFIIGNDTGFSHLAAMTVISTESNNINTFIIYSRHDYSKWNTGKTNIFPIYTELSNYLKENRLSINRNKIDVKKWGIKEWAMSITINDVYNKIILEQNLND